MWRPTMRFDVLPAFSSGGNGWLLNLHLPHHGGHGESGAAGVGTARSEGGRMRDEG